MGAYGDVDGLTLGVAVGVGVSVGITEGSGVSVGRIPGWLGDGRGAEGRTFGRAEAVAAGAAVAGPAAAADGGLGDGVTLAAGCGVGLGAVAAGARRWGLNCRMTTANAATMTTSAIVDAPSAVPNDVLSESQWGFLGMASDPPCEPLPAGAFYPRFGRKANFVDGQWSEMDRGLLRAGASRIAAAVRLRTPTLS